MVTSPRIWESPAFRTPAKAGEWIANYIQKNGEQKGYFTLLCEEGNLPENFDEENQTIRNVEEVF